MHSNFWQNLSKPILGLSPMDGITDSAFRQMVLRHSHPSVVFTEFTTVEGLSHGAVKPLLPFIYAENERPIIAQIFGTDPEAFYQACFIIAELGFDGIDINMGCPSKSVSSHGAGAGLIRTPRLAQEIVKICRQATLDYAAGRSAAEAGVAPDILHEIRLMNHSRTQLVTSPNQQHSAVSTEVTPGGGGAHPPLPPRHKTTGTRPDITPLPISVKTRIGYDSIITREWLKHLLEVEPDNISLHGRTLKQMYSGEANWEEIARAADLIRKERPTTTFLGNGDIADITDAHTKITQYNLGGVLIGRASFGNPWIFSDHVPSTEEKLAAALEHCELYESIYGQHPKAFAPMKKHLGWYSKGFSGAKELRLELMACNSATTVKTILHNHALFK